MPEAPGSTGRPPIGRLILLGLVVLTGLVLLFTMGRQTPAIVAPIGIEDSR